MTNQNNEKSKNGKRIALILLALLLIAAIAFGAYTYSKYVSSGNGSGSATVAQWGFEVKAENSAKGDDVGFSKYYTADGLATGTQDNAVIKVSTSRDPSKNIVAPGAHGEFAFKIKGTAEVNATLSTVIQEGFSDIYIAVTNSTTTQTLYYNPICFSLTGGSGDSSVTIEDVTLAQLVSELESNEILNKSISAGTTITESEYTLKWEWPYEAASDAATLFTTKDGTAQASTVNFKKTEIDKLDTALGLLATSPTYTGTNSISDNSGGTWSIQTGTANTDYCLDISFDLVITITQVQIPNA